MHDLLGLANLDTACRLHLFPAPRLPVSPCRWFLAQNPLALAKLEKELDAAGLLKTPQNPNPRQFTYGDIGKLHWLDCCIKVSALGFLSHAVSGSANTGQQVYIMAWQQHVLMPSGAGGAAV